MPILFGSFIHNLLSKKFYSYPEGFDFRYSDLVMEMLKKDGIICYPTAEAGLNGIVDSLFHLKRIPVT
ncbi:MAG TPA: hypothetical protein VM123_07205 [archaeon]|nr:hypothetical protein [archaeon]